MIASFPAEKYDVQIILILTVGFAFASVLGYITHKIKISPIIGYLVAGYLIGPYSPGFVADLPLSEQLAEIGVVLMMFGVGLHFKWEELMSVKNIALPGAIVQTLVATLAGVILCRYLGWSYEAGIVIGLSVGVASTVVLVRILEDHKLLGSPQGHIAVGWLIVEDLITVVALLLLPVLALSMQRGEVPFNQLLLSILFALLKCAALIVIMFVVGFKIVAHIVYASAKTRSQELFTLTVLALILVIATGAAYLFGTSLALGAFIAGMIIGRTEVRHQAAVNALPLRYVFSVVFFLSIGMLFNPHAIIEDPLLFFGLLGIILLIKPVVAFLIVIFLGKPVLVGLTVAAALAQIGEFSFILAQQAMNLGILPDIGFDEIVAAALISIALNPLFFKFSFLAFKFITKRVGIKSPQQLEPIIREKKAILVGYGPIGQAVYRTLEQLRYDVFVIDTNVEVIEQLIKSGKQAVYGDAAHLQILEAAEIEKAKLMVITSPDISSTQNILKVARQVHPDLQILARANFSSDQEKLEMPGIQIICNEEEAKNAFIHAIMRHYS